MIPGSRSAETIVVLGTGRTAPGIAAWAGSEGARVFVAGRDRERAEVAAAEASRLCSAAAPKITGGLFRRACLKGADLVIESVVEDFGIKKDLCTQVVEWTPSHAIIATNTSSLSVTQLGVAIGHTNLIGLHFLHPAHITGVVEIIPGETTDPAIVDALCEIVRSLGKEPLLVERELPGFIWNRLQFALLRESLFLLEEGVADIATIDKAVSDGLAPRWLAAGPFATVDLGGLSTFTRIAATVFPSLSDARTLPSALETRDRDGQAFYAWTDAGRSAIVALREKSIERGRLTARARATAEVAPLEDRNRSA